MLRQTVISTYFMVVEIADMANLRNREIPTGRYLGTLLSKYGHPFVEIWVCPNRSTSRKWDGPLRAVPYQRIAILLLFSHHLLRMTDLV